MTYLIKITHGELLPQSCEQVESCTKHKSAYFSPKAIYESESHLIIGDVKLHNKPELSKDLNLANSATDLEIIASAFTKWRQNCVDHLIGDFSFVLYNKIDGQVFAARDHIGVKPLYIYHNSTQLFLSNCPLSIAKTCEEKLVFDQSSLLCFLSLEMLPLDETLFKKIKRLPAAHSLSGTSLEITLKRYWKLTAQHQYSYFKTESDCVDQFRKLLFKAVDCRLDPGTTACELSGGLDSGTISAIAANLSKPDNLPTYSNCLRDADRDYLEEDEKYLIEELVQKYKFQHQFLTEDNDNLVDIIKENLNLYPYPLSYQTTVASRIMKKAKDSGAKVILSGFGGDECISYHNRPTIIYEHLQNHHWSKAINELKVNHEYSSRNLFKYMIKAFVPQLVQAIRPREMYPYEANPYLNTNFLANWTPPLKHPAYFRNTQDRSIYQLTKRSHTTERLESFALLAATYDIEYRFPLLDIRLLEFFVSLAPELKFQKGIDRYLLRQASKDLLPESIRLRADKSISECPAFNKLILKSIQLGNIPKFDPHFNSIDTIQETIESPKRTELHKPDYLFEFHFPPVLSYQLFLNHTQNSLANSELNS